MDTSKASPCTCDADEIDEWKDASGLLAGGDPGGVTPAMLREHQMMASDVILAARCFIEADESGAASIDEELFAKRALRDRLAAYLGRWPEE